MAWDVAALRKALVRLQDRYGYGGWTRIAETAGVSTSVVSRTARGVSDPEIDTWVRLYEAFPDDIPPPFGYGDRTEAEIGDVQPTYIVKVDDDRTRDVEWIARILAKSDRRLLDDVKRRIEDALEKKRMMEELRTLRGIVNQSKCEPAMGENHQ